MSEMSRSSALSNKLSQQLSSPDRQTMALRSVETPDEVFLQRFKKCFEGRSLLHDETKIREASRLFNALQRGKKKFLDSAIEMGRAVLRVERAFGRDEWHHFLDHTPQLIGMKKSMVSKLRAVAYAIDSGKIQREHCPNSFSTVYELTTFPSEKLQKASQQGLLSPATTRQELRNFIAREKKEKPQDKNRLIASLERKREKMLNDLVALEEYINYLKHE